MLSMFTEVSIRYFLLSNFDLSYCNSFTLSSFIFIVSYNYKVNIGEYTDQLISKCVSQFAK